MDIFSVTIHVSMTMSVRLVLTHVLLKTVKIKSHIKTVKSLCAGLRVLGSRNKNGVSTIKIIKAIPKLEIGNFKPGIKMVKHKVPEVITTVISLFNIINTHMTGALVPNNGILPKTIKMVIGSNTIGQEFTCNMMGHSKVKLIFQTVKVKAGLLK